MGAKKEIRSSNTKGKVRLRFHETVTGIRRTNELSERVHDGTGELTIDSDIVMLRLSDLYHECCVLTLGKS